MVKAHKSGPPVALYARLSPRPDGNYEGVDVQEKWGRAYAAEHWPGKRIVVYADAGLSASKENVTRPSYERLKADIAAGRVAHLWAVEQTRLTRREVEWFALSAALEAAGLTEVHTNRDGILRVADEVSGIRAVISAGETRRLRGRVRDRMAENAAEGKPHGQIPFGYKRVYDERTGKGLRQEIHEPEAAVVRELFDRLAAGHALHAIARDFLDRGIRTRSGIPFSAQHLRDLGLRAAYAGLRVHDTSGSKSGHGRKLEGAVTATWPAIVALDRFYAVRDLLTNPKRLAGRPGRARYLLSMIGQCGVCSDVIIVKTKNGRLCYQCRLGHVLISMDDLDEFITEVIVTYLSREDVYRQWVDPADADELDGVRGELASVRKRLADAKDREPEDEHEAYAMAALTRRLSRQKAELEQREQELAVPLVLRGIAGPDAAARWEDAPMSTRREVVRELLQERRLGELRVVRRPAGISSHVPIPVRERLAPPLGCAGSEHDVT